MAIPLTYLGYLPEEMLFRLADDLSPIDILSLCESNSQYEIVCLDRLYWQQRAQRDLGVDPSAFQQYESELGIHTYLRFDHTTAYRGCERFHPVEECLIRDMENKRLDLVKELIENDTNLQLLVAAYTGDINQVQQLLQEGANGEYGMYGALVSPLWNNSSVLYVIMASGISPNHVVQQAIQDRDFFFLRRVSIVMFEITKNLAAAGREGDMEMLDALTRIYNFPPYPALLGAIRGNQTQAIEDIATRINQEIPPGDEDEEEHIEAQLPIWHEVLTRNHQELISLLINNGFRDSGIIVASELGLLPIVRRLTPGQPQRILNQALEAASQNGHEAVAQYLVSIGAEED